MKHLDDGVLRRMQDEPFAATLAERDHLDSCASCRDRLAAVAADAERAGALLSMTDAPVEAGPALARLRRAAGAEPRRPQGFLGRVFLGPPSRENRLLRPAAVLALATSMLVALVATGAAEGFIKVFQPDHFVAVQVNPGTLSGLPDLSQFGTQAVTSQPRFYPVASVAEASKAVGFSVLQPGTVPAAAKGAPTLLRFTALDASFTFVAAKARAYAAAHGKSLPAMPAGMDGSTIHIHAGPGVVMIYGQGLGDIAPNGAAPQGDAPAPDAAVQDAAAPDATSGAGQGGFAALGRGLPQMAIVQMKTPVVSSDGASVQAIENYLVSLPGVPADLAVQIRAIGDPATTLPVPVPIGQSSHDVDVNGVRGLFVGDSTGLGAGTVWQKAGLLYGVVGTMTEDEVVGVARSIR